MRAAWYDKQGPARDVLVVGEMPDPYPAAGEVRIRIAASGINPGDIKKRGTLLATACLIRASFRTATAPVRWIRSVMAYRRNGSVDECGVTARNPIAHSEQLQSLPWFRWIMSLPCPIAYRRMRALALAFPASRLTAPFMSEAKQRAVQYWCKGLVALSECVRSRLRDKPVRA
jgi:hypothetical protein